MIRSPEPNDYPNAPPWIDAMLADDALTKTHRKQEFDKMVARVENDQQQPQWKPAQCSDKRHVYDTDGKRIVGETCRCGKKPIKRMK